MDTTTGLVLAVFILVVLITLFALVFRMEDLESRLAQVPEPALDSRERRSAIRPLGVNWLVEGYCMKDRKRVEMVNPHPFTMVNGRPAMAGVCPHCGTKIYKISKSYGVVQAIFRAREDRERMPQGRREVA